MTFDLSMLNQEQLAPVQNTEGAVLVTAGAGSGKTRLLTHRIAHIAINNGVATYNILAITFTNKAAREMKERLFNMVPNGRDLRISTIHSLCVSILRSFIHLTGFSSNFSIYDEDEKKKVLKRIVSEIDPDDEGLLQRVEYALSGIKNEGMSIEEYVQIHKYLPSIERIERAVNKYAQVMKENNALDFDDLLVQAYDVIRNFQAARDYYQSLFRYIHVDEFQDTNVIQYRLIKLLAGKWGNLFVVGDEDQSIYGWRGANIANIRSFIDDFNPQIYKLEQNYRSTKSILDAANEVIKNNSTRIEKKLWTSNGVGDKPIVYNPNTDIEEADFVMQTIKALKREGMRYSDMAVLMRVNSLSRVIEQKFLFYGIPYRLYGGFRFFERKEVKDILAYVKTAANPYDDEAAARMIMFPKKGIGEVSINKMMLAKNSLGMPLSEMILLLTDTSQENAAQREDVLNYISLANVKKLMPLSVVLRTLNDNKHLKPSEFTKLVFKLLNLNEIFDKTNEEESNRLMNIGELLNSMVVAEQSNPELDLNTYVQQVMLYSETDDDYDDDKVNVATIHSAKGLEYRAVFVIGIEEKLFPLARSLEDLEGLEEERRLMYVALTRAKERLYLTHARSRYIYGRNASSMPSRFLAETGLVNTGSFFQKTQGLMRANEFFNSYQPNKGGARAIKGDYVPKTTLSKNGIDLSKINVGQRVMHSRLGEGIIKTLNAATCEADIAFESMGVVTMDMSIAPIELVEND